MDSEMAINKADLCLREIPPVKSTPKVAIPKKVVKEELQSLRLTENLQEKIIETLKYIHGPDFKLNDSSNYKDNKSNLLKKYWVERGSLVVKGGFDFSMSKDEPTEEFERLKQFGLLRLESYGFHKSHCIEAFNYCGGDIESALYLLYIKYFNRNGSSKEIECDLSERELTELRDDEKSSLDSIYEKMFKVKLDNVWILTLKLDYLIEIFHNKERKEIKNVKMQKKEKCKNIIRGGHCKYGDRCRFSHEVDIEVPNKNKHLEDFTFELEIRFPPNIKYPYEPPLIFLRTDSAIPPLAKLHISKRLYDEAKILSDDGIPSVYTVTELVQNEEIIREHLKQDVDFIPPNQKLFDSITNPKPSRIRSTHYEKGKLNRDNRKAQNDAELAKQDQIIVYLYKSRMKEDDYQDLLEARKKLPAWNLRNEILNCINQSQVVVVSGETGCGKSTQVPQYIFDDWIKNYDNDKKHIEIVCTQPRRISALGVAERVSTERLERVGNTVGYQIRLESKISQKTRITFCTTGILLRRLEGEPTLPNVTHIIIDEVHERSEESDFLLLILKDLLQVRPDLKVILMSATLNASIFSDYFRGIPIVDIPGRTFPVEQFFMEDIMETTGYVLEEGSEYCRSLKKGSESIEEMIQAGEVQYIDTMPKSNIKDENLTLPQIMARYRGYGSTTWKNIFFTDVDKINYELIESTLQWIVFGDHHYPRTGTILIFLPGFAEITTLYDQLRIHPEFGIRGDQFILLPLHSSLTSEEQAAIFKKPKIGQRKIVISTNLAETSITIDDCVFVIDSGKMKEKRFDPNRNMESLDTTWVTRANALQRKGRAGRVMSGVCIHLYTRHRFDHNLLPQPIPEIMRIPLEQLILSIKVLPSFDGKSVSDVIESFIEPPSKENITTAIKRLENVGALDRQENLTPLGHHLAALPVDVRIGKLMLYGAIFGCIDAALTMAACLSYKSPFVSPFGKKEEAMKKKKSFSAGFSDQITTLMAYKKFLERFKKSQVGGRNFANENFLSYRTLVTIGDIKYQFLEFLVDIGFIPINLSGKKRPNYDTIYELTGSQFNRNGENLRILSSILCAALYPNIVKILTPSKSYIISAAGAVPKEHAAKDLKFTTVQENVFMHPSSVNHSVTNFPSPFLVYQEKVQTSKVFFRECTMVPIIPLLLFTGYDLEIIVQNGNSYVRMENGWIMFQVEEHKIAEMLKLIRQELFDLLEQKIQDPLLNLQNHDKGKKIITTILSLVNS